MSTRKSTSQTSAPQESAGSLFDAPTVRQAIGLMTSDMCPVADWIDFRCLGYGPDHDSTLGGQYRMTDVFRAVGDLQRIFRSVNPPHTCTIGIHGYDHLEYRDWMGQRSVNTRAIQGPYRGPDTRWIRYHTRTPIDTDAIEQVDGAPQSLNDRIAASADLMGDRVIPCLLDWGLPPVVLASSGRGLHGIIRHENFRVSISDLPIIQSFLDVLGRETDTKFARVDKIATLGRCIRIYGTPNLKERPLRTRVISVPDVWEPVPLSQIKAILDRYDRHPTTVYHGTDFGPPKPANDLQTMLLEKCKELGVGTVGPYFVAREWIGIHLRPDEGETTLCGHDRQSLMVSPDGELFTYKCFHNSCGAGKNRFADLLILLGKDEQADDTQPTDLRRVEHRHPSADDDDAPSDAERHATMLNYRMTAEPGAYLDQSETGSGKTFASGTAIQQRFDSSLMTHSTHVQVGETVKAYQDRGIPAVAYPELTRESCLDYDTMIRNLDHGLPPYATCNGCTFFGDCDQLKQVKVAEDSQHAHTTKMRASNTWQDASKKEFLSFQEDSISQICPSVQVFSGFDHIACISLATRDTRDCDLQDVRDDLTRLAGIAKSMHRILMESDSSRVLDLPTPPSDVHRSLEKRLGTTIALDSRFASDPHKDAMRCCLGILRGAWSRAMVSVDRQENGFRNASVICSKLLTRPKGAVLEISDATANLSELEMALGEDVHVWASHGPKKRLHAIRQLPVAIWKASRPEAILAAVVAIMTAYPIFKRWGVICHKKHLPLLKGTSRGGRKQWRLAEKYRQLIAKSAHFHSGESRGSNEWPEVCDAMMTLGTPMVPPAAHSARLFVVGFTKAALLGEAERKRFVDSYLNSTPDGWQVEIEYPTFENPDWKRTSGILVRSELVQAIGRARSDLPEGIPVICATTEPLGYEIADWYREPKGNQKMSKVLGKLKIARTIMELGGGMTAAEIAEVAEVVPRRCRRLISELESSGIVGHPSGEISGVFLTDAGSKYADCRLESATPPS